MITRLFKLLLVVAIAASVASYSQAQQRQPVAVKVVPQTGSPTSATKASATKSPANKASANKAPAKTSVSNTSTDTTLNAALKLLSSREKELLDEINYARANPGEYLKALEAFRKNFRGKEIHYPEGRILVTNEGVAALDDAIKFLRDIEPLPPLELRSGMVQAAKVHANDLVLSDKNGHRGSDGSQAGERIDRFGRWDESFGENIVYDSRTARYDVMGMIIDDGTANRGHRENLFAEDFRVIGIAMGTRANGTSLGVVTFAGGFSEKR